MQQLGDCAVKQWLRSLRSLGMVCSENVNFPLFPTRGITLEETAG